MSTEYPAHLTAKAATIPETRFAIARSGYWPILRCDYHFVQPIRWKRGGEAEAPFHMLSNGTKCIEDTRGREDPLKGSAAFTLIERFKSYIRGMLKACAVLVLVLSSCVQSAASDAELVISNVPEQYVRIGIDGERLWYWHPALRRTLAALAVKNVRADYVRVAINCAYERELGNYNPGAYDLILDEMSAIRETNPQIKFFATPRPLPEAYTEAEATRIWGGSVPWSCYPAWVQSWISNGTNSDGTTKWVFGSLNNPNLTRYLAEYLNFMNSRGFTIDYLDVVNENRFVQPETVEYVSSHIDALLDPGVKRPLIVAPSSWSYELGVAWITSANPATFDISSCHNTGGGKDPTEFAATARGLGKEVWNSELHSWIGTQIRNEVLTSGIFWDHLKAGFTGLDTWLFFGNYAGRDHSMVYANGSGFRTSCKYEIFKEMVNNANGGHHLKVNGLENYVKAAAFILGQTQTVWVLNYSTTTLSNVNFKFVGQNVSGLNIGVKKWLSSTSMLDSASYHTEKFGVASGFTATNAGFNYDLGGESLYCFRLVPSQTLPSSVITVRGSMMAYHANGGSWKTMGDNDVNNDGRLGSDGYIFYGSFNNTYPSIIGPSYNLYVAQLPPYVIWHGPGANYGGITQNAGYATIDNPRVVNGAQLPAAILWGTGSDATGNQHLMSFTISGLPTGRIVRVGVLAGIDNSINGDRDPASITLALGNDRVTVGNANASLLSPDPLPGIPNSSGWVFFDVTANGTYALIAAKRLSGPAASIAGLTFDSVAAPVAGFPANISFERAGDTLNLSWPDTHQGWVLEYQNGLGTNWAQIAGSAFANAATFPLSPTNSIILFRLRQP